MNIQKKLDSYQQAQLNLIDHDREVKDTLHHMLIHQRSESDPPSFVVSTIQQLQDHLEKNDQEKHQWYEYVGIDNEPTMLFAKFRQDLHLFDVERFLYQLRQALIKIFDLNNIQDPQVLGMTIPILIEDDGCLRVPDVVVEDRAAQQSFWRLLDPLGEVVDHSLYDGKEVHPKFPISSKLNDLEKSMVMRPCRRYGFWIPNE